MDAVYKITPKILVTLIFSVSCLFLPNHQGRADELSRPVQSSSDSNPPITMKLAGLEPRINHSTTVLADVARMEELLAMLEHEKVKAGWKIIGGLRGGYVDEQLDNNERREYYPSQVTAGLTYPLLGKRKEEKSRILELETGSQNEGLRVEIRKLDNLESLRSTYILFWAAELKRNLADAYLLEGKEILKLLERRVGTGHLLRSDYLEFASAVDLVKRERAINANMVDKARDLIETLTGVKLATSLSTPPDLPATCTDIDQAVSALADDPEIMLHQNNVELELARLDLNTAADIKGDLTIRGMVGSSENVNTDSGYGGMVTLDFFLPLNPFSAESKNEAAQLKRLKRFQRVLQVKTEELKIELKDRFRRKHSEQANLQFAQTRLQAATELLREKTLRVDRIDGDVLEQLQKSRNMYYRTAADFVDAEARVLNSSARILRFCPVGGGERILSSSSRLSLIQPLYTSAESPTKVLARTKPRTATEEGKLAVYLWRSQPFIDGQDSVELLRAQEIDRVLISLNGAQLAELESKEGRKKLIAFLNNCRVAGISPGLLLGEPSWILPEGRGSLLEILHSVNDLPFDQVHLDLEPAQLDFQTYGFEYLAAQLLRTLQLATEVTDFPVEISVHPRLLATEEIDLCFGCALGNLDLERVVVMIYRTDSDKVLRQMTEIANNFPDIPLALAQSVETILGPKNSYAHLGKQVFRNRVKNMMKSNDQRYWQGDIYIQDWSSYIILPEKIEIKSAEIDVK